jgi:hypothetical protein
MNARVSCDGEVRWQQFRDPANGLVGDPFDHLMKIECRIKALH